MGNIIQFPIIPRPVPAATCFRVTVGNFVHTFDGNTSAWEALNWIKRHVELHRVTADEEPVIRIETMDGRKVVGRVQ